MDSHTTDRTHPQAPSGAAIYSSIEALRLDMHRQFSEIDAVLRNTRSLEHTQSVQAGRSIAPLSSNHPPPRMAPATSPGPTALHGPAGQPSRPVAHGTYGPAIITTVRHGPASEQALLQSLDALRADMEAGFAALQRSVAAHAESAQQDVTHITQHTHHMPHDLPGTYSPGPDELEAMQWAESQTEESREHAAGMEILFMYDSDHNLRPSGEQSRGNFDDTRAEAECPDDDGFPDFDDYKHLLE